MQRAHGAHAHEIQKEQREQRVRIPNAPRDIFYQRRRCINPFLSLARLPLGRLTRSDINSGRVSPSAYLPPGSAPRTRPSASPCRESPEEERPARSPRRVRTYTKARRAIDTSRLGARISCGYRMTRCRWKTRRKGVPPLSDASCYRHVTNGRDCDLLVRLGKSSAIDARDKKKKRKKRMEKEKGDGRKRGTTGCIRAKLRKRFATM